MFDFERGPIKLIKGARYPHCHTVFVDDERRALIDPASNKDTLKKIHQERAIDILILTHGHEDHIMYLPLFPDAEFWVHGRDAHVFSDVEKLIDCYPPETEEEKLKWKEMLVSMCHYEVRKPERLLKGGEVLSFGNTSCQVIHTPGHTPGHCAFHFPEQRILFLGDLDLVKAGAYYGDVESSLDDTISSLELLMEMDVDFYLTGHGEGVLEGSPEHIKAYLRGIFQREEKLLEFLQEGPKTLDEVTKRGIIYGEPKILGGVWDLALTEKFMMSKHLDRLEKTGKAKLDGNRYFLL